MAPVPGILPCSKAESHLSHLFNFPEPLLLLCFSSAEAVSAKPCSRQRASVNRTILVDPSRARICPRMVTAERKKAY
jgi:hypothetical protein